MARIGKVAPAWKCRSPAPARPESAPAAGLGLCLVPGRADLFRKFIARTLVVDPGIIRGADDRDDGGNRGLRGLAKVGAGPEHRRRGYRRWFGGLRGRFDRLRWGRRAFPLPLRWQFPRWFPWRPPWLQEAANCPAQQAPDPAR